MKPVAYQKITLRLLMLRSVNQKNKVNRGKRGRPMYTDPRYLEEVNRMIKDAREQAEAIGWQVSPTDCYVLLYRFTFPQSGRRDLHNPLKPVCDALVQAGLLQDDKLTVQEDLVKLHSSEKKPASCAMEIVLYRFLAHDTIPLPVPVDLEGVFDHLAQKYDNLVRAAMKEEKKKHAVPTPNPRRPGAGRS